MTTEIETYEVFRYKVVYPGGTYIRISPATDAENTGLVLEFGTIFDASKSLFLDGINYAKVSNGSGWVFEKKDDVQILELLQIIRVPVKRIDAKVLDETINCEKQKLPDSTVHEISLTTKNVVDHQLNMPLVGNRAGAAVLTPSALKSDENTINQYAIQSRRHTKVENRLWRDVRARCGACATFDQFLQLVTVLKISIDGLHAQHEQRVLNSINLIASITGQCSTQIVRERGCMRGVDVSTCLWVLVHMGSRVSHTMSLIVEAANQIFESASTSKKAHLLRVVLEVGNRTKIHAADLARQVDILPDDIRNFLQRWIIVQSFEKVKTEVFKANVRDDNEEIKSEGHSPKEMTHSFRDEEFALHKVQNTPVARSVQHSNTWSSFTSNGLSSSLSAWFGGENSSPSSSSTSSFLPYCGSQSSAGDFDISRENPRYSDPTTRKINSTSNSSAVHDAVPFTRQREGVGNTAPGTQYIWGAIARHVEMFSDTDMQLAGLI